MLKWSSDYQPWSLIRYPRFRQLMEKAHASLCLGMLAQLSSQYSSIILLFWEIFSCRWKLSFWSLNCPSLWNTYVRAAVLLGRGLGTFPWLFCPRRGVDVEVRTILFPVIVSCRHLASSGEALPFFFLPCSPGTAGFFGIVDNTDFLKCKPETQVLRVPFLVA